MSLVDEPITTDGKAGYSSMCRRSDHATCRTAGARCTCACHGSTAQTPPTAKEITVPHLAPVADPPPTVPCTQCEREFGSSHALRIHASRSHGDGAPKAKRMGRPPKPAPVSTDLEVQADPWALIVGLTAGPSVEAVVLSTREDAVQVVQLLDRLDVKVWAFRVADSIEV